MPKNNNALSTRKTALRLQKTLTAVSIDMDGCLWLPYEIVAEQWFYSTLSKKEGELIQAIDPKELHKVFASKATFKITTDENIQSKLAFFLENIRSIQTHYIALTHHFLQHGNLNNFAIIELTPEYKAQLCQAFQAHYSAFMNDALPSTSQENAEVVLLCGSNRQNLYFDYTNSSKSWEGHTASVVHTLNNVVAFYQKTFKGALRYDTFLLGDVSTLLQDTTEDTIQPITAEAITAAIGTEYGEYDDNKVQGNRNEATTTFLERDEKKLLLLYAQMQRLANANPSKDIVFKFYDDRADIIDALQKFYTQNKAAIPHNVELQLIHKQSLKNSTAFDHRTAITGTGSIDPNWHQNSQQIIKRVAGLTIDDSLTVSKQKKISLRCISSELIKKTKVAALFIANTFAEQKAAAKIVAHHLERQFPTDLLLDFNDLLNRSSSLASLVFEKLSPASKTAIVRGLIEGYGDSKEYAGFLRLPVTVQQVIQIELAQLILTPKEEIKNFCEKVQKGIDDTIFTSKMADHATLGPDAVAQAKARALFQQAILTKGLQAGFNTYRFDPQGHVITEVTLSETDYQGILNQMEPTRDKATYPTAEKKLASIMGMPIKKTTYCSLDVQGTALEEKFKQWLIPQGNEDSEKLSACYEQFMASDERSSVIALQLEAEKHMRLCARAIEFAWQDKPDRKVLAEAHNQAATELNQLILGEFRTALINSYDGVKLNFETLNEHLDNSRLKIIKRCQSFLLQAYLDAAKITTAQQKKYLNTATHRLSANVFASITATGNGDLRTDARNGTSVYYSRTNVAAGNKTLLFTNNHTQNENKPHGFGLRLKQSCAYHLVNQEPKLSALSQPRLEARVPSIAINGMGHNTSVQDVAAKMARFSTKLRLQSDQYDGPIHYCLLTSLTSKPHNFFINRFKTKADQQRKSASRILKGSHLFNKQQIAADRPNALCFVQNIGVKPRGLSLSYSAITSFYSPSIRKEATLMAELSLLSALSRKVLPNSTSPHDRQIVLAYHYIHGLYRSFLETHACVKEYFCDSRQGKQAIQQLQALKAALKAPADALTAAPEATAETNLAELVTQTLQTILAHDLHLSKQYGMLLQSLSIFVQNASVYGGQDANDGYSDVANRVELLDGIQQRQSMKIALSEQEHAFIEALKEFQPDKVHMNRLQCALNQAYNQHNLHTAGTMVALEDRGGPAKIQAVKVKKCSGDPNLAELGYLTKAAQCHASAMRADNQDWAAKLKKAAKKLRKSLPKPQASPPSLAGGATHSQGIGYSAAHTPLMQRVNTPSPKSRLTTCTYTAT